MFPILGAVFLGLASIAVESIQETAEATSDGMRLELSVAMPREIYALSDEIQLETKLTNVGDFDVYIYSVLTWGFFGSLEVVVFDEAGNVVERDPEEGFIPPTTIGDETFLVRLTRHHFLGMTQIYEVTELVEKPGRYKLKIIYGSPAFRKYYDNPRLWARENGTIEVFMNIEVR